MINIASETTMTRQMDIFDEDLDFLVAIMEFHPLVAVDRIRQNNIAGFQT